MFEELPKPSGTLWCHIPAYRLPRDILDQGIQFILDVRVEAKTDVRVGHGVKL